MLPGRKDSQEWVKEGCCANRKSVAARKPRTAWTGTKRTESSFMGKTGAQRLCGLPVVTLVAGQWGPRNQPLVFILVLPILLC